MENEKDAELRVLRERLARLERAASPPAPTKRVGTGWGIAVPILGITFAASAVLALSECGAGWSGYSDNSASDWDPPARFIRFPGARGRGGVATEWVDPRRSDCRSSGTRCWVLNVVTEQDCPRGLYASVTLLDEGGANVGWTNDSAQGVQAGEVTRMVFRTYERGSLSPRIAEINCY